MKITKLPFMLCLLFPMMLSAQLSYTVDDMLTNLNNINWETGDITATRVTFDNRFAEMTTIASDDELAHIALTEKPLLQKPAVAALIARKSPQLLPIFTNFTITDTRYAVSGKNTTAASEFYKAVAQQKDRITRKAYYERTASKAQIAELRILFGADFDTNWTIAETDSLLTAFNTVAMENDSLLPETLNAMLRTNNYVLSDYARVKYFAAQYQTPDILAGLANFKNNDDVPFLLAHFDQSMVAISHFPHPAFMPKLQSLLNNQYQSAEFQNAVAGYKNAQAAKMLTMMVDKIVATKSPDQADALLQLYNIIENANCPLYDTLLKRMQRY